MSEKNVEKDLAEGALTTGNFTIQAQLGNSGKTMTLSGYIYSHNKKEDISKQIDIYHDVIDRQQRRAEIPELEAKLEQRVRNLHQVKDHMLNLKQKKEKNKKLSSAEEKQINDLETNVRVLNKDIEDGQQAIKDAKEALKKA